LEACLELMQTGAVVAIQDMGAAGLTCSAVEMGAKGNLGLELNLDAVPCREAGMTAYEMMLSESQERMLMVLDPAKHAAAEAVFVKWGLDFAVVGVTTDTLRFVVKHNGEVMADLPIKDLGDQAPIYDRPWVETPKQPIISAADVPAPPDIASVLLTLIGSPDLASRRWVIEQYDHFILGNTIHHPGGSDAGVVRVHDGPKGLAFTSDVTPRYCFADPYEGGKQAIAESWRNLTAVGSLPIAVTDNLNFGSPERPEIMGQFVGCLKGIGEACRALDYPIVSGNVSLYNETQGVAILPTPTIGGVGLVKDVARTVGLGLRAEGDAIILIGETAGWLGQSIYLREINGREEGAPPPVDLSVEKRNGDFVRSAILAGTITAAHDLSDGGLGIALAEMVLGSAFGADIALPESGAPAHALLFGEDQGRYLVTVAADAAHALITNAKAAGVPAYLLGSVVASDLTITNICTISKTALVDRHEAWFPAFMNAV
jgi:phosphoribosylformylglycinamidine synthase